MRTPANCFLHSSLLHPSKPPRSQPWTKDDDEDEEDWDNEAKQIRKKYSIKKICNPH